MMPSDQDCQPRKRRRPPKSCEQCRKRKVKCDQNTPCNQCVRLTIPECTYDPSTVLSRDKKRPKSFTLLSGSGAPPTPASEVEHDGLSSSRSLPLCGAISSTAYSPSTVYERAILGNTHPRPSPELLEVGLFHLPQRVVRNSGLPSTGPPGGHLHGTVTKTRLLGRSHWTNIIQEFGFIHELQKQLEAHANEDVQRLAECKALGRTIKSRIYSTLKTSADLRDHVPVRKIADDLVDNYFRAFESCYRILHIPSFRRQYVQFWQAPDSASQAFIARLLLVLAIGTCVSHSDSAQQLHLSALEWINAAQTWLNSPFTEKSRLNVAGIQALCLLLIAREMNSVGPDLVWVSAGSMLRSAMLIGLHRDPSNFPRLTPFQAELRRRLWATIMEISLQSAMTAGGSPMLSPDMFDCQPPMNLNDEDLDEKLGTLDPAEPDDVFTQTSIQIALLRSSSIRYQIARMLNDFRIEQTFLDTLAVNAKLAEILNSLSLKLRSQTKNATISVQTGLGMYELLTCRFLIGLNQTFAIRAIAEPMYYFSRKLWLDSSLNIASIAFPRSAGLVRTKSDFQLILDRSSGTPKAVIGTALLIIMLELATQLQGAHSTPTSVSESLIHEEMFRAIGAYSEWALIRLEWGETNPKGHIFSACGVAHLRALERGESGEIAALEAGRKALATSAAILRTRLDKIDPPKTSEVLSDQFGEEFRMPFGDDFEWDDFDPSFNIGSTDFFLTQL